MNTTILDEPTRRKQFLMFFTSMAKKMGFPAEMTEEQRQMAANGAREMLSSRANAFKAGRPVSDYFL
ncbi:hypothetical protein SARC_09977 [Sphaeroforma arctica JP610]|uniref:Uncharacterized protein n=1 Tax=Sphaeroforma arctica JP610 TaxID=667725 RepID=A0A0L0FLE6_9EUKA|nr:hypothetical protein SARC_09977 [Sphaeroforma arctica JP610]KNC77565.1 hypothetical protein SARC_09977 [Sphaeroforma arctica JP610]|eukprot:XP_014151467.1 hypothetical protein SARC_09977 [Sphaeroforma arctica JP610]